MSPAWGDFMESLSRMRFEEPTGRLKGPDGDWSLIQRGGGSRGWTVDWGL